MFSRKIRIRDVNRYLRPVIKDLKAKHIKVTNPDFEDELESITGIRYRMAKTYLFSPKPWQEVKGNAKVKHFIIERRKSDYKYKAQLPLALALLCSLTGYMLYALYSGLKQEVIITKEIIHTKAPLPPTKPKPLVAIKPSGLEISLPSIGLVIDAGLQVSTLKSLLKFKDRTNCRFISPSKAAGRDDFLGCSYTTYKERLSGTGLNLDYTYNSTNKLIYKFTIESTRSDIVEELIEQSKDLASLGFKKVSENVIEKNVMGNTKRTQYISEGYTLFITHTGINISKEKRKISTNIVGNYQISITSREYNFPLY